MKELIRGIVVCVFMLNMVHVMSKEDEKKMAQVEREYKLRKARMMGVNKQLAIYEVERQLREKETNEPVLAGY